MSGGAFALVLVIYSLSNGSVAATEVGGFESRKLCEAARQQMQREGDTWGRQTKIEGFCVQKAAQ